jgi:hypothetical protein
MVSVLPPDADPEVTWVTVQRLIMEGEAVWVGAGRETGTSLVNSRSFYVNGYLVPLIKREC